jgi:hypothetical protein
VIGHVSVASRDPSSDLLRHRRHAERDAVHVEFLVRERTPCVRRVGGRLFVIVLVIVVRGA